VVTAHGHTVKAQQFADGEVAPRELVLALDRRRDQYRVTFPVDDFSSIQIAQGDQHAVVRMDTQYFLRIAHIAPGLKV
jgi:hypothetical protein